MTAPDAPARRKRRAVSGVLVLDKPGGMTSNAALQRVTWLFRADKAGHTGALDPLATGVLPLCFGEATKFSQGLLDADKAYRATARLGVVTDSGDADGKVVAEHPVPTLDFPGLELVLTRFRGEIDQVPSMFSALKRDGRPLYELARAGQVVEREARRVRIDRLELVELEPPNFVIDAAVSKGTYIRSLVEDIGRVIGCGAHVVALRRTCAGPYSLDQAVTLEQIERVAADSGESGLDALLLPPDSALAGWPAVALPPETAYHARLGQPVRVPADAMQAPGTRVALYEMATGGDVFLGIGEITGDGRVAPRRLVNSGTSP